MTMPELSIRRSLICSTAVVENMLQGSSQEERISSLPFTVIKLQAHQKRLRSPTDHYVSLGKAMWVRC